MRGKQADEVNDSFGRWLVAEAGEDSNLVTPTELLAKYMFKQRQEERNNYAHENMKLMSKSTKLEGENNEMRKEMERLCCELQDTRLKLQDTRRDLEREQTKVKDLTDKPYHTKRDSYQSQHKNDEIAQRVQSQRNDVADRRAEFTAGYGQMTTATDSGIQPSDGSLVTRVLSPAKELKDEAPPSTVPVVCPSYKGQSVTSDRKRQMADGSRRAVGCILEDELEKEKDCEESQQCPAEEMDKSEESKEDKGQSEGSPAIKESGSDVTCSDTSSSVASLNEMLAGKGTRCDPAKLLEPYMPMVSIQSFGCGQLALFYYSEEINMFVAYSTSPTKYFLHPDSHEAFETQAAKAEGTSRRCPLLGLITDLEYCCCTRVPNPFRLSVGTKFYRLTAKPYIVK